MDSFDVGLFISAIILFAAFAMIFYTALEFLFWTGFTWFVMIIAPGYYKLRPWQSDPEITNILNSYCEYYRNLNPVNKKRFEKRLHFFLYTKYFKPFGVPEVTMEMKVLIGACAVQLTFGLRNYLLMEFPIIRVYPDSFHYRHHPHKFRGFVSSRGFMALSWNHIKTGIVDHQDGINLGLHELAHALRLEKLDSSMSLDFHLHNAEWEAAAMAEIQHIRTKRKEYNRQIATNSIDEFFAISVEYFFERPEEMEQRFPHIYFRLRKLLNQDPQNKSNPRLSKHQAYQEVRELAGS